MTTKWDWFLATHTHPWKRALSFLVEPIIANQAYSYREEADLHWTLGGVLQDAGVPLRHEARLTKGGRIDFLSRRIGIEIKVRGSVGEVQRQLQCYGRNYRQLDAMLLLTTCRDHLMLPDRGYGIPMTVVHIIARQRPYHRAEYRTF